MIGSGVMRRRAQATRFWSRLLSESVASHLQGFTRAFCVTLSSLFSPAHVSVLTHSILSNPALPCMLYTAIKRLPPLSFRRSLHTMLATSTRPAPNAGPNGKGAYHTVTALKRWSCDDKDLPNAADVKAIHVYDFDNTCTQRATRVRNEPLTK